MAKKDELMKDAMEIASQSGEPDLVEDLLRFFTDTHNPECFSACLYTCYDLVKPDVAVELAWCNGLMDLIMPFLIQFLREYTSKVCAPLHNQPLCGAAHRPFFTRRCTMTVMPMLFTI